VDALQKLTGGGPDSLLGAAVVSSSAPGSFCATLLCGSDSSVETSDAWLFLALALRYSPYGCRMFATSAAVEEHGISGFSVVAAFPGFVHVGDVRRQGAGASAILGRAFADASVEPQGGE
jgi:hypothetical protein